MGGMVGQWLGANAPERFGKIILSNTACYYPDQATLRQWWVNAGIRHNGGMSLVMFDGHAKFTKEEFLLQHPEWFIAGNHTIPADELAKFGATGR